MKPVLLKNCPKVYTTDLDKAKSPEQTIKDTFHSLDKTDLDIIAETKRIDNNRLGIPVYLSVCGTDAKSVMPTRKQMGKGSSPAQANASAIMELIERYSFFSFWDKAPHIVIATWEEAKKKFGDSLISINEILISVNDHLSPSKAEEILNTCKWQFYPSTRLVDNKIVWLPLDWFKLLGEFNGSSAGNSPEESILQGLSELIERHVSAIITKTHQQLPTIDLESCADPVLYALIQAFKKNKINLILKDITLDMPLPTVAALAWDESTFPEKSEIVFTAGTATSPAKAAIRAITEVAQLGGDFNTGSCYEASGLPKFTSLDQCQWLLSGPDVNIDTLPSMEQPDILEELLSAVKALLPLQTYVIETTNPQIRIPAHYTIVPGLQFRERDANQSLGLFVGRKLTENASLDDANAGLELIDKYYPGSHFIPFFKGLLALKSQDFNAAVQQFEKAALLQPDAESKSLVSFYAGYAYIQNEQWNEAIPWFMESIRLSPQMKEAYNFLGVAQFKLAHYEIAEQYFNLALKIDRGSATDLANRGICKKMQGNYAEAKQDLETALKLDPALDYAHKHLMEL